MRKHLIAKVEVKINLRAPPVRVRRKGIPDAARLQGRQAHHELAALDAALVDEFVNRPLVGGFLRPESHRRGFGGFHHAHRMGSVRRTGEEIKLRGMLRIIARERNGLRSHGQINTVLIIKREGLAVGHNFARPANIDGAELAAFEKKRAAGFLVIRQLNGFARRHHAADHQAIEVGEMRNEFAGNKKVGDMKGVALFLCGQADKVLRARSAADGVVNHASVWQNAKRPTSVCRKFYGRLKTDKQNPLPIK